MKFSKNIVAFGLTLVLLLCLCAVPAAALDSPDPDVRAAILVEEKSGNTLYEKNADKKLSPASMTKLMTMLLAVEEYEAGMYQLKDEITVPSGFDADLSDDSSTADLVEGEKLSYGDLLYCCALASANDACNVLAICVAGSISRFVTMMNEEAKRLGCTNTNFVNTHGLSDEQHYSTARDMTIILEECLQHPILSQMIGTSAYTVPATNETSPRALSNTNKLLDRSSDYYYEYCKGGKTGSTDDAGFCLASVADNEKMRLLCVVMGATAEYDDDGDVQIFSYLTSRDLFEWGFNNFSYQTVLKKGQLITKIPVSMGDGADAVNLAAADGISALVPNDVTESDFQREIVVFSEEQGEELIAPINAGEVLGRMTITLRGNTLGTVELIANSKVELQKTEYLKNELSGFFASKTVKIVLIVLTVLIVGYLVLLVRYNVIQAKKLRMKRAKLKERQEMEHQQAVQDTVEGIRVLSREEEQEALARQAESKEPISFEDFYDKSK